VSPDAQARRWLVAFAIAATTTPAAAQWLHQPTRGVPRTADGKVDLTAPAPRMPDGRPDLSGIWQLNPGTYVIDAAQDLKLEEIQPWAVARFRERLENFAKEDPACFLPSGPRYYIAGVPKIVQTPAQLVVLYDDLTYRQIFLDGRTLPTDPNPSFMGYSTGHWEGDALVVESTGLDERTQLDTGGHPHTDKMKVTERFHRTDLGHMDLQVTFDDRAIYAKPMVVPVQMRLVMDDELIEYLCRENEKDYGHIKSRASAQKQPIPLDVLSRYVGAYVYTVPGGSETSGITVTLVEGELTIDGFPPVRGRIRQHLIPLSETRFAGYFGRPLHFVIDATGAPVQVVFEAVEPGTRDIVAIRK
jgi:hypothetical protein